MKSEIVKFRIAAGEKRRLAAVASNRRSSLSSILRRAAALVASGRIDEAALRADMIEVRRLANAFTAIAIRCSSGDATAMSDATDAANALRRLAAIHIGEAA